MPLYNYRCPSCGWTGDRTAHIAVRDEQQCTARTRSEEDAAERRLPCGMRLVREEIPEDQGRLSGQWSSWQRS